MTWFERFQVPQEPGFRVLAGRDNGLTRLLLASGRMAADDHGTVHLHAGDEERQDDVDQHHDGASQ